VFAPPASHFVSFEPMTAPIDPFRNKRTLRSEGAGERRRILPAGHRRRAI
jgi:hypothetical protein